MASSKIERASHFAVIFIAISALFISIWQGYIAQKHNRLTVRPYFNITAGTNSINGQQHFSVLLANQGYGPAIIKKFEITVDGKVQDNWNEALRALDIESSLRGAANFQPQDVFGPGREQSLLTVLDYKISNRINLKITYQSIYEEEFEIEFTF